MLYRVCSIRIPILTEKKPRCYILPAPTDQDKGDFSFSSRRSLSNVSKHFGNVFYTGIILYRKRERERERRRVSVNQGIKLIKHEVKKEIKNIHLELDRIKALQHFRILHDLVFN